MAIASADKIIDKQLSRVRRHIRLTDLISGFMILAAGLLVFLSLVVLVDHWIFGLGTAFRWLALVVLILGPAWFCATRIAPAMIRGINPAYAAQTIERGEPTLKNSVLNYLLLRRDRAVLHEVVYQAVQQQAAADVSHVAVEQTVDRSAVIKAGYALVVVMGLAAAYKILSPKDPVQTVRRVIAPWADIVRPARVSINDVQPGDAEVLHGDKLIVSALVRGVKARDEVKLLFSTEDGQLVDRALTMKLDSTGLRHTVDVTPEAEGLEQPLSYKIVAGDTATEDFHIRVVSAPTIQVDAIEYDFPAYTRRPREVVRKQGDVKALEGTRVTIRARTNQPIHTATLHLHANASRGNTGSTLTNVTQRIPMEFRDSEASRSFFLEFADDRRTGKQSAYHLEFVNAAGQASQRPIVHRIEVVADLPPEVEILTPQTQRVEVPLSGVQPIEIRAIDPDFGLAAVRLKATSGTKEIFRETLLGVEATPPGQVVKTFDFRPKQWNLAENDQISYWAEAADNRTAVNSESPAPNIARSRTFHMVIVADPPQPSSENPGDNQTPPEKSTSKQDQNVPPKPDDQKRTDQKKRVPTNAGPQDKGQQPEDNQPPQQNQENTGEDNSGKSEKSNSKTGQQSSKNQKNQKKESPTDQSGGEKGESGESGSNDQSGSQTGGGNSAKPGDTKPMPGQGTGGQQPGGNTPQKSSDGSDQTSPGDQSDAAGQNRESQGDGKRSEPLHDGEVFERALNKLKGNQNSKSSNQGSPTTGDKQSPSEGSETTDKQPQTADNQKQKEKQREHSPGDDSSQAAAHRSESTDDTKSGKSKTANSEETPAQPGVAKSNKSPAEKGSAAGKSEKTDQQNSSEPSKQPGVEKGADEKGKNGEKGKSGDQEKGASGEKSKLEQGEKAEGTAESKQGDKQQADKEQGEGDQQKGAAGEGGKSANNTLERPEEGNQAEPKSPEGGKDPGIADNGQSGAGLNSKDKQGSASAQQAKGEDVQNSDRKKEQSADNQAPQKNDPPGISTSKKQSDSKGGETGDRSGGGKKGSGQGAKQPGNDSAGSQSSSDDGAGQSHEAGKGETSKSAGDKQSSPDRTGKAGDKKGPGSGSTTATDGQKPNSPADPQGENPPASGDQKSQANPKGGAAGGGNSGTPGGGGAPGDRQSSNAAENPDLLPGDAANLDYANRATDMVLEYLRDQQTNPDRELMDELGWTQDDLRAFLDRWRSLKEKAVEDPNAKRQLDETLRSLGIQPTKDTRRRAAQRTDESRGLRESGTDSKPPAIYQDQFRAFKKGASRGSK